METTRKVACALALVVSMCVLGHDPSIEAAQEGPAVPKKITVDEAVAIALKRNHDYVIAVQRRAIAKEKINSVWSQLMPVIESEASLTRQRAENGQMSLSDGQNDIRFVQLRFGINPGVFYNSLKASRDSYKAACQEVRRLRSEITYNVIKSYFSLLVAEEMIKLRRDSLVYLRENEKDVRNMYRTGSVPRFELLQARVKHKSQEPLLHEAENDYRVAMDLFNYHLGAAPGEYAVQSGILDDDSFRAPQGPMDDTIRRLIDIAMRNRPEIVQLSLKRDIARSAKNMYSSYYLWPTFTLVGGYGRTQFLVNEPAVDPITMQIPTPFGTFGNSYTPDYSPIIGNRNWQETWSVRVAATYRWSSLLPSDQTSAAEREERIKVKEAEEEIVRIKRMIALSLRASYSRLHTAVMTIASQKENVASAAEGLRIAKESYRAGIIKNAELLSSEVALTNARTGYINAVHNYYTALAELRREVGSDSDAVIFAAAKQEAAK